MRLAHSLARLFNLRAGEGQRLLILYTMSLTVLTGMTWADAIVQAAFLQRVGVQYLPWVFISCAVFSFGAMFVYSAFADRVSNTRLLIGLLTISGVGILLGLAALAAGQVGVGYLVLFLVLQVPLLDVYNVHWATYVNGFYDIRTAKRIVPVLSTTARFAGIIGGLSMPLLNRLLSPASILVISVASLAVMGILAAAMPRLLHEPRPPSGAGASPPADAPATPSLSYGARLREGYAQIARSPFLRWMALATLSMTILLTLLTYGTSAIFQAELKTTVAISNFLGVLSGAANLVILPFQLFVLSRLIGRLGLGNASLIFPLTSLAAAGGLAVAPGLGTAAFAHLDRTALRTAFRIPIDNLFYNAVPARVKARTRAFVGGLVVPIGSIVGGLLLLMPVMRTSWFLPAAMLTLALALTLAALRVRRHYGPALVDLLAQEDYAALALQAPSPLEPSPWAAADPATLAHLVQKLNASTTLERAIFMAQLITAVGGDAAVPIVAQAVQATHDGRLRASLVDVLVAADLRRGSVRQLYSELLGDADGQVRLAAIGGLEQIDGPRDDRYLAIAARLLADPQIEVRLRVLPALVSAGNPAWRRAGISELRALLDTADPHTRARALGIVKSTGAPAFLPEVLHALADGADEVRLAAALAVEAAVAATLSTTDREALVVAAAGLRHDPIERVRVTAVTVLGSLSQGSGPPAAVVPAQLVETLADPSPAVREHAVEVLVSAGSLSVPIVHAQLDSKDSQQRQMAAVVLARIEPRRYAPLVRGPILNDSLRAIYQNLMCQLVLGGRPGPALAVLGRAQREWQASQLDAVFHLLATIHDPAAIQAIAHALASPQPAMRANGVEALESLTTPQTAALVGPLFEPDLPPAVLQTLAKRTWDISIATPAAALRLLLGESHAAWPRTLAAAALWELGAAGETLSEAETAELFGLARADADAHVRAEVDAATVRVDAGSGSPREYAPLSTVRRITLLHEVPFCQGMTVEQLRVLANVCDEAFFAAGTRLYSENDPGGVLYVVAWGRVAVEQEKRRGSLVRLSTVEAHACLGEADFLDGHPHTSAAVALQDTLTLCLRHEPLIVLARQYPDLSLALVTVLGARLRTASDRVAGLTRTHPRALHRLFDQLT